MFRHSLLSLLALIAVSFSAPAFAYTPVFDTESGIEDLNSADPDVDQELNGVDEFIRDVFGDSPFLDFGNLWAGNNGGCYRASCPLWVDVSRAKQRLTLYVNGQAVSSWSVSTGMKGYSTPNFDKHPDGRIYTRYSSSKYPGGNFNGLGNMPYAVFIQGGYALHGTPKGNWRRLGSVASHGCIRQNPQYAQYLNAQVRAYGIRNTWITVRN